VAVKDVPRLFISRLLETFFRRKWLYLLALVPFVALGVVTVKNSTPQYRSSGTIQANKFPNGTDPFGQQAPGLFTAAQINTAMSTDKFLTQLIAKAQLTDDGTSSTALKETVKGAVSAASAGFDVVSITAVTSDPTLSVDLAAATIETYRDWESTKYATLNPVSAPPTATTVDGAAESAGDATAAAAEAEAADEPDAASKAAAQKIISQRFPTVDTPTEAVAEPHRKKDAITLVLFLALGALVVGAAVVVATLMDKSVRYSEEVETQLHVPVLATIPDTRAAMKPLVL